MLTSVGTWGSYPCSQQPTICSNQESRYVLNILLSYLCESILISCVGFPCGLPHSGFHFKTSYKFFFSLCFRPHAYVSSMTWSPVQYLVWILFVCNFNPISCYFLPLRPRDIPHYPVIKHPQHMSFGNVRMEFQTYMKQHAKLYLFIFTICIFWIMGRHKILYQTVAGVS